MKDIGKSKPIRDGLRKGFRDGTSKMAQRRCYGYDTGSSSELVINPAEVATACWIFERYLSGDSSGKIACRWVGGTRYFLTHGQAQVEPGGS